MHLGLVISLLMHSALLAWALVSIQTAREFQMLHWSRLAFNALGSAFIFTGFLRVYRHQIAARLATEGSRAAR